MQWRPGLWTRGNYIPITYRRQWRRGQSGFIERFRAIDLIYPEFKQFTSRRAIKSDLAYITSPFAVRQSRGTGTMNAL